MKVQSEPQTIEAKIIGELRKLVLRDIYRTIVEHTIYEQIKSFRKNVLTAKKETPAAQVP